MSYFKFKIIFINIALLFSLYVQAYDCTDYFKKSDFAQNYSLSMEDFLRFENLAHLEIFASGIRHPISKSATLDEVSTKLAELLQAGVPIEIYEKIKEFILKDIKHRNEREENKVSEQEQQFIDFKIDGTRAVFHRIEPGTFQMGETSQREINNITEAFELMATQTTQIIWRTIAELANRKFPGKYNIPADPSHFKGDTRPVESISFDDTQNWIDALNELSQLGEPSLAKLIRGHKKGDVYRLPTEAQWEFVARGRGQYNENYHFGHKESDLEPYAWWNKNSQEKTHPVAKKKPLVVDGNEFFDMHGNVWEWMANSWYFTDSIRPSGYVTRGGSWSDHAMYLRSPHRLLRDFSPLRNNSVGFRLLRISN